MIEMAIQVEDLQKTYGRGLFKGRKVHALRGVSLEVERGRVFGLLGPNGAGKTTLIKILLNLVHKDAGAARLFGSDTTRRIAREQVGYLPENHRVPQHHTARSAMNFFGALHGLSHKQVAMRQDKLFELVNLQGWEKTPVRQFSKGMKQRLGLALAMIHDPELLILDEPTDGVDPVGRREIRDTFKALRDAGKTIFLNSHLLQETELVCDRVAILHLGELRRVATVDELTQAERMTVIEVTGDLASALKGESITVHEADEGLKRLEVEPKDTADLNRIIDLIRDAGAHILTIRPATQSLEDAFLKVVQDTEEADS